MLKSVHIIEKDVNGDLLSWCFPTVEPATDKALKRRCGLADLEVGAMYRFSRYDNTWQYTMIQSVPVATGQKVLAGALVLLASDFNPEKYKQLLSIMCKLYEVSVSPMPVMKAYMSVVTKGEVSTKLGNFKESEHDPRKALVCPIKHIFEMFGMEAIVIWVAMLIKKRVFVYSDRLSDLQAAVRAFPLIGTWHRQNWNLLRPYMTCAEEDMADLNSLGVFVAGFTDPACASHTDMYDLYVDLSARSYTIADHAQGDFMLTKYHKQTAEAFLALQEQDDQALIKGVAVKTKELLTNIEGLKGEEPTITMDALAGKKLPPNMAKFLFNVALAEGMCTR